MTKKQSHKVMVEVTFADKVTGKEAANRIRAKLGVTRSNRKGFWGEQLKDHGVKRLLPMWVTVKEGERAIRAAIMKQTKHNAHTSKP